MRAINLKLGEKYKLVRPKNKIHPIIYYDVIGVNPLQLHCYSNILDWECWVHDSILDERMKLVSNDEFQRWIESRNEL